MYADNDLKSILVSEQEIENTVFYASAGGVVNVEVYGTKELKAVSVEDDFEIESKEDIEMLEDMIMVAMNDAGKKADADKEKRLGKYSQGLTGLM